MDSVEASLERMCAVMESFQARLPLMQQDLRTLADRVDALSGRLDAHVGTDHHCVNCRCDRKDKKDKTDKKPKKGASWRFLTRSTG